MVVQVKSTFVSYWTVAFIPPQRVENPENICSMFFDLQHIKL